MGRRITSDVGSDHREGITALRLVVGVTGECDLTVYGIDGEEAAITRVGQRVSHTAIAIGSSVINHLTRTTVLCNGRGHTSAGREHRSGRVDGVGDGRGGQANIAGRITLGSRDAVCSLAVEQGDGRRPGSGAIGSGGSHHGGTIENGDGRVRFRGACDRLAEAIGGSSSGCNPRCIGHEGINRKGQRIRTTNVPSNVYRGDSEGFAALTKSFGSIGNGD